MATTVTPERIKFAKKHGYKYVGNGCFLPKPHPMHNVNLLYSKGLIKPVSALTVHERINLRSNMSKLCRAYNCFVIFWFRLRLKGNDFYAAEFFDKFQS